MDLEKLTKHQIVLLTLLISFVTSIATGIVSVSLMNQAPPSVTRTINQIVERTVETVAPQPAAVASQKTVVVKEDDLTAQSIATVQKSIIRIVEKGGSQLVARGVIADAQGTALTDQAALTADGASEFEAILYSGERVPLTVRKQTGTTTSPIAVVDVAVGTSTGFAPATFVDVGKLKLGQSVIRIGGTGTDIVGSGIIAALPSSGTLLESTVSSATPGSVVMTLFGEVIGMATSDSLATGSDFYSLVSAPQPPATPTATKSAS